MLIEHNTDSIGQKLKKHKEKFFFKVACALVDKGLQELTTIALYTQ